MLKIPVDAVDVQDLLMYVRRVRERKGKYMEDVVVEWKEVELHVFGFEARAVHDKTRFLSRRWFYNDISVFALGHCMILGVFRVVQA